MLKRELHLGTCPLKTSVTLWLAISAHEIAEVLIYIMGVIDSGSQLLVTIKPMTRTPKQQLRNPLELLDIDG